jgi:hypothetical protein
MYYEDVPKNLRARWPTSDRRNSDPLIAPVKAAINSCTTQQARVFRAGLRDSLREKARFLAVLRSAPPTFLFQITPISHHLLMRRGR